MTTREVLEGTLALLQEHEWIQGDYARDDNGATVHPMSAQAWAFCLTGALRRVAPDSTERYRAELRLVWSIEWPGLPEAAALPVWNDAPVRTKANVLALLRRTIEACP